MLYVLALVNLVVTASGIVMIVVGTANDVESVARATVTVDERGPIQMKSWLVRVR